MKVRVAGETLTGRAIDLRGVDLCRDRDRNLDRDWDSNLDRGRDPHLGSEIVADAVRGAPPADCPLAVECPDPGPVHDHVGVVDSSVTVSVRAALADAARSRGHTAPQADELDEVLERLDDLDPAPVDLERVRKRVADASDVEAELSERVATLQGRVQALRETDGDLQDVEQAESALADATRRLSEVQTERIAAEQALDRAREEARSARATRRERLRLEDRAGNLRREARAYLAGLVRESFEKAHGDAPRRPAPSVRTALAIARVADLDAPVVLACEENCFESPRAAARWLDASVLCV